MELEKLLSVARILKDYNVVAVFSDPLRFEKEKTISDVIETAFSNINLTDSFNEQIFIVYDDGITVDVLLEIHRYLTHRCCNIENISIINTHSMGIAEWYKSYLKLFKTKGFKIFEAPLVSFKYVPHIEDIPPFNPRQINSELKYYFSFYGGSYGSPARDFLVSAMSSVQGGFVDYLGGFTTSNEEFDGYLESITSFTNRKAVDDLLLARHNYNYINDPTKIFLEKFSKGGFQCSIDAQSACHVIRETLCDIPFSNITEKTIRSFIDQQIPIPLGINNIKELSHLGFCMDYDIINYDYQEEPIFYNRITKVCNQLELLKSKYTLSDLADYLHDKKDLIEYNYNYIRSAELFENIIKNLIREINE